MLTLLWSMSGLVSPIGFKMINTMDLFFTEDQMIEMLLMRGYMLYQACHTREVEVYRDNYLPENYLEELVWKDGKFHTIESAFRSELKTQIIYNLWQ